MGDFNFDSNEIEALLQKYGSGSSGYEKSEKTESENIKVESTTIKGSESESVKPRSSEPDSIKLRNRESERTELRKSEPERTELRKSEPKRTEPGKSEPERTELGKSEPEGLKLRNPKSEERITEKKDPVRKRPEYSKVQNRKPDNNKRNEAIKKQRKRRITNIITDVLLVIFILCFLGCGVYLGIYFLRISKAETRFEDLKSMIDTDSHSVAPEGVEGSGESKTESYLTYTEIDGVSVQTKFAELYKKNHDFVGWLTIPDTKIDYPVMFTPDDEEYYIHRDFDKEESVSGTLFISKYSDWFSPSDNVLIYGHNMKAGTMFADITSYESEEFYNTHKTIYFDTLEDNAKYEVIAAFRTEITNDENSFMYYKFFNAQSEKEFDEYINKSKELTPYTIAETASFGDKLITLSTCAYHADEGRFVVVAKKVY